MREKNEAVFYSAIYCVLNRKQKTGNAAYLSSTTGLPNIFSVAGHFHMRKFFAGHKCFCDITISYCDVTNPLVLIRFMR